MCQSAIAKPLLAAGLSHKHKKMKRVQLFNTIEGFEEFINRTNIEVIQVDVKMVEQSYMFQQNFAAVVFYRMLS